MRHPIPEIIATAEQAAQAQAKAKRKEDSREEQKKDKEGAVDADYEVVDDK